MAMAIDADDDDDDDDVDLGFAGALPKTGHLFCSSCVCCACALGWPTALNNGVNHSHEICAKQGDDHTWLAGNNNENTK